MKKIFLMLVCLFTVFVIVGASFATSDFDNAANNASIEISNSQNKAISIEANLDQSNQYSPVSENGPKLNITGPKINASNLKINGPKINGNVPKIQVPKNQGILSFQSSSSGMKVAGGSVVADTGNDLVDFLDDSGTINKFAYGVTWTVVKGTELIGGYDFSDSFEDYLIKELAFGDLGRFL